MADHHTHRSTQSTSVIGCEGFSLLTSLSVCPYWQQIIIVRTLRRYTLYTVKQTAECCPHPPIYLPTPTPATALAILLKNYCYRRSDFSQDFGCFVQILVLFWTITFALLMWWYHKRSCPRLVAFGRCIQHRPNLKIIRENGEECLKFLGQEIMVNVLLYIGNMETIPTDFLANAEHNCGGWWPMVHPSTGSSHNQGRGGQMMG